MPTATVLKKSILEATIQMRSLLQEAGVHDYALQEHGDAGKVLIKAVFLSESNKISSTASLYRLSTKHGDPRIWFRGLPSFAGLDEILGVFLYADVIYLINLSQITADSIRDDKKTVLSQFLEQVRRGKDRVSDELLSKLRALPPAVHFEQFVKAIQP